MKERSQVEAPGQESSRGMRSTQRSDDVDDVDEGRK